MQLKVGMKDIRVQIEANQPKQEKPDHADELGDGEDILDELAPLYAVAVNDGDEQDDAERQHLRRG